MKPKWIKKGSSEVVLIQFYIPKEEYDLITEAKGKLSWREFVNKAALLMTGSQRLQKKKGKGTL